MQALVIAIWILVIEVTAGLIFLIFILLNLRKEIRGVLEESQNLVKSLREKVDTVGSDLEKTMKNSSEITDGVKKTVNKMNTALTIGAFIAPIVGIFYLFRKESNDKKNTKSTSSLRHLLNMGRFAMGMYEGYSIYRKNFAKGGKKNVGG